MKRKIEWKCVARAPINYLEASLPAGGSAWVWLSGSETKGKHFDEL